MPSAMRFSCTPFLSHDQTLHLSSLPKFLTLVLSIFFSLFALFFVRLINIGYISFWFFFALLLYLLVRLLVCAWLRWLISLTYQYLSVSQVIVFSFLRYPSGGDCKHPGLPCLLWLPFFDDAKRGKIDMTMIILVWLGLSWFLQNFSPLTWLFWH